MVKPKLESLYLELMKKTLTFILWEEPGIPFEHGRNQPHRLHMVALNTIVKLYNRMFGRDMGLVRRQIVTEEDRREGKYGPLYAHTMIGLRRLDNIQFCIEQVLKDQVEGDLIETGVWRGGGSIFMRAVLAAHGSANRRVFVADSFAGLPKPDPEKYPQDKDDPFYKYEFLKVSQEEVAANFEKYGLLDDQVVFLKGWFKDTLPTAPIEKLAVMRLDGDMYESTMDALTSLYPKLSQGGYCIIDDYTHLLNCQQAVDDFRRKFEIASPITKIDYSGVYWRKE